MDLKVVLPNWVVVGIACAFVLVMIAWTGIVLRQSDMDVVDLYLIFINAK